MRRIAKSFALALCLCASVLAASPARAQLSPVGKATLDFAAELDQAAKAPDFVGLAVAVVRDGHVQLMRTYGVREVGGTEPVDRNTLFRIASLSKGFAATLAALEAKDGRFSWRDAIAPSLPQFKLRDEKATQAVTIEDILSHRVGLPAFAYDDLLERGVAPLDILTRYALLKPACQPGQCFAYQNTTFNMIASVIERATGEPYADRLRKRIFEPLGMRTASLGLDALKAGGDWARPHVFERGAWKQVAVKAPYYLLPAAAGVNASIDDMAAWLIAQTGARPEVIPPDVLDQLRTERISTITETRRARALSMPVTHSAYGLGWRVETYAGNELVTHSGSVEGYLAYIAILPKKRSGIVILSNTRASRVSKILPTWLDYELGLAKTDWLKLADLAAMDAPPPAAEPQEGALLKAPGVR